MRAAFRRDVLAALTALSVPTTASAQRGGSRGSTVRMVVPFAPGGTMDTTARTVAGPLGERLSQTWIVENRSGANGAVGADVVARAAPDGSVLMCSGDLHLVAPLVMRNLTYDVVGDFTPIGRIARENYVLIGNPEAVPFATVPALLKALRERPGGYGFANPGLGSIGHLASAAVGQRAGAEVTMVTYRGTGPALTDLISGSVGLMVSSAAAALPLVREGRLRAYAVMGPSRIPTLPDVPSADEVELGEMYFEGWRGLWGPKGLPVPMVESISAALRDAVRDPAVVARFKGGGLEPVTETANEFARFVEEECRRNAALVTAAGIKPE